VVDEESLLILDALYDNPKGLLRSEINFLVGFSGKTSPSLSNLIKDHLVSPAGFTENRQDYIYLISPGGRAAIESIRQSNEEKLRRLLRQKKLDRRWWATTIIAIIGAATGLTALIWNILMYISQQAI